ncbi:alkaline phosphatase family protein [Parabacteroides sp. OttesenSCG-928-N08]|nr:alkaline phosphatase family protein [Parabacteroides sp. OttesenSCG-928-N08]
MRKLISSLIVLLAVTNMDAQTHTPKMVVCITVDQLRGDYIEYFYNTFGDRGFKRLYNEGLVYRNIGFEFADISQASAFATLFSGTNPEFHGITGDKSYDFDDERERSILYDKEFLGNYTKDNFSPRPLISSTIGDELKIASQGRSDVYAIAPEAEAAILSAGHSANGAFWMDNYNGKWATTTYYRGIPWYIDRYNNGTESVSARLDKMIWTPALPIERYNAFPYLTDNETFKYTFNAKSANAYFNLKTSPFINKEINKLAMQFLEYGAFGTRGCPDMLAVTYYAGNYKGLMNKEYTREIQDLYYQLDKSIEELLDAIDKKVGLKNTLIVFTGTGYFKSEENIPDELLPGGGDFYPKRCIALLNMYLMNIYGQQNNWVTGYYNNQIWLNRKAIENAKLDLWEVQQKAADFVQEFSGIQQVVTDRALLNGDWNEGTARLRHGTHHRGRGDIIIELQPGWRVNFEKQGEKPKIVRNNAVMTPLIFLGVGIEPQHIYREVKATEVAPSVTHVLRIRPPNATQEAPLYELNVEQ